MYQAFEDLINFKNRLVPVVFVLIVLIIMSVYFSVLITDGIALVKLFINVPLFYIIMLF